MSDTQRLHAIVRGRVQGVTFRATTRDRATALNITGWVRNNRDGTVELIAEGERDTLETLVEFLHEGPPAARVSNVDTQWQRATGEFERFSVKR